MQARFDGRVAVVTGAASGIGKAVATRLAGEGARVLVADRDGHRAEEVADSLAAAGGVVLPHVADVTIAADVQAMFAAVEAAFGRLDIVCNNAGVDTPASSFEETDDTLWERTLSTNLRGVILGCKYGIPILRRYGGGAIVNTASMAGIVGMPSDPVYAASKGGVVMLTRSLRNLREEAGIRVNCVCPAFVDTPMVQRAQGAARAAFEGFTLIEADEVAGVIAFLASDAAAHLSGRAVRIMAGEAPALLANPRGEHPLFQEG